MNIDLNKTLTDCKGNTLKVDATSAQLSDFFYHAVSKGLPDGANDVASRRKEVALLNKVSCGGIVAFTDEERASLTAACAASYAPLFFGPIDVILNPVIEA